MIPRACSPARAVLAISAVEMVIWEAISLRRALRASRPRRRRLAAMQRLAAGAG